MERNPPAHLLQRISNNPSVDVFKSSFEHLRSTVKNHLSAAGADFSSFKSILDLGCGVGRFEFAFKDEFRPDQRIYACEVHRECAEWCQRNINWAETLHTDIEPPLPYADNQFDLVYGLSVFTHLNLDLQFRWAAEVHRILKPGGVAFLTFHGLPFIALFFQDYLRSAATREINLIGDKALFSYLSMSGKKGDEGQVEVASAQNFDFVKEQFSSFEILRFLPQSDLAGEQDLYIFRRPVNASPISTPYKKLSSDKVSQALKFNINGQGKFRVYSHSPKNDICSVDCLIKITAEDGIVLERRVPLNIQRLFGPSQYFITEVDVPPYSGSVTVNLACAQRLTGEAAEVRWTFPHFY